jgi:LuxR family maltose regulon positive regulatory protein
MVHRPRLTNFLKKHQEGRSLTLISAPAGYGKSTLVSCWLDRADCPTAWLSLDEKDNDLQSFSRYFLAAIRTIFPDALQETESLLTSLSQPPVPVLAKTLINEIDRIGAFFILVLDDYQLIEETDIHDLLNELLLHPPSNLHLVISTRMDPPLSLATMRGKGKLLEVRIPSLRFSREESLRLIKKMTGASIDDDSIAKIDVKAEGWVTGLRLAALAMRHRVGQEVFDLKLTLNNRYVSEYLLSEILTKQAATFSDCMLKTSIPARFSADLCDALCFKEANSSSTGSAGSDFNGHQFLEWLRLSNFFIIPLDGQGKWYRYHHIFREFLQQELIRRFGQEQVRELHAVLGRWYAENDFIEEAFYHLLPSGEISQAIELVALHRYKMMNRAQWGILENWLDLFQDSTINTSPELFMLKTWLVYQRGQWAELPGYLQHMADLMEQVSDQETANRLAGEINALRSLITYHQADAEGTISLAQKALEMIPSAFWIGRVFARLYLSGGLLMVGEENSGFQTLYGAFEEEKTENKRFKATLLTVACYLHWLTADLQGLAQAANQAIALSQETGHNQILRMSNYHLGCVRYQQNDLPVAEDLFASVTARPYENYGTAYTGGVCGLGITYQVQGRDAEAKQVIERAIAFYLETGNTTQLPIIQALQAEVALRQGNLSAAGQWANKLDPLPPFTPSWGFFAPHLTLVKVWLAQNTPDSREKAADLLNRIQEFYENTHNTRFLIETLALRALLEEASGDLSVALETLEQALRLAQPGIFIRVFVDMGPAMARLLAQLKVEDDLRDYVGQIRSAFPLLQETQQALKQGGLLDPLTDRELEILELLYKRLSNKEIAAQLVISPGTVKGHTIKIYQKLDVNGRRQAVQKSVEMGLLIPA